MSNDSFDRKGRSPSLLNENVERIVRDLARGAMFRGSAEPANSGLSADLDVSETLVRWALDASRARSHYLPSELVSDPVWCLLLELLMAEIRGMPATLSGLSETNFTSASAATRWARALQDHGLIKQRENPHQSESPFIELSPLGSIALRRYFRDLAHNL